MNVRYRPRQTMRNALQPPYIYPFPYTFVRIGILLRPASVNWVKFDTKDKRYFLQGCMSIKTADIANYLYLV